MRGRQYGSENNMSDKITRLREQKKLITRTLISAVILFVLASFIIKNEESKSLMKYMAGGCLVAAIIFNLFKSNFGYKPTREELENKEFGKEGDGKSF